MWCPRLPTYEVREMEENVMDFNSIVTIDLSEYGLQGTIEMGMPSYKRVADMRNEATRYARICQRNGDEAYVEGLLQSDLEELTMLMYVRRAPFPCTLKGWFDFTEVMDAQDKRQTLRLAMRLKQVAAQFEAIRGPFVSSLAQTTPSSE